MQTCDTIVVGAGPAGLATAFWLLRRTPTARIAVLEARAAVGGHAQSEWLDGFLCEHGPQGIRPDAAFDELVRALDCERELVAASPLARRRWVGRGGRLHAVPSGPLGLLTTRLLSWRGRLRVLREGRVVALAPELAATETVGAFVTRRFGAEAAQLARTMLSGIFAGDADRLEARAALPLLCELEREHGSVLRGLGARRRAARTAGTPAPAPRPPLLTFRGGMHGLADRLRQALGNRVTTDRAAAAVTRASGDYVVQLADGGRLAAPRLVLACPAHASARLLADTAPELARELDGIAYAAVASVWLGLRHDDRPARRRGFGFLLDPADDSPALGVLHCSDVFPEHAPPGHTLLRAMFGGVRHPEALDFDDDRLVATARALVERHHGRPIDIAFRHVVRVRRAIPQYEVGHGARLERIDRQLAALPGLALRGNAYRGVAVTTQLGSDRAPRFDTLSVQRA